MRDELAQATVEFALVSVSVLLLLVGAFDLGRAIYYYDVLANAARDGARLASVLVTSDWAVDGNAPGTYPSTPYLGTATVAGASSRRGLGMDSAALYVTVSTPQGTASGFALPVVVSTQYVYSPFAGALLGIGPITVTAQSTMRMR